MHAEVWSGPREHEQNQKGAERKGSVEDVAADYQ